MVATDGHRLSYVEKPNEVLEGISGEKRVLIPRKALQELYQLLSTSDVEKVEFADDEHTLFFRVAIARSALASFLASFPNFEAVMPRDNTKFAVVRSSEPFRGHPARSPNLPTSGPARSGCASKAMS